MQRKAGKILTPATEATVSHPFCLPLQGSGGIIPPAAGGIFLPSQPPEASSSPPNRRSIFLPSQPPEASSSSHPLTEALLGPVLFHEVFRFAEGGDVAGDLGLEQGGADEAHGRSGVEAGELHDPGAV